MPPVWWIPFSSTLDPERAESGQIAHRRAGATSGQSPDPFDTDSDLPGFVAWAGTPWVDRALDRPSCGVVGPRWLLHSFVTANPLSGFEDRPFHEAVERAADLMTGLPSQSLMAAADEPYHRPLRLSAVVHAPVERVEGILADREELATLLDNDWLSLPVVDPTRDHRAYRYGNEEKWTAATEQSRDDPVAPTVPAAADD